MTLAQAITEIRNDLAADPGLASVQHDTPRENVFETLTLLVYVASGGERLGTGDRGSGRAARWGQYTIVVDLVGPRKLLPDDYDRLLAYTNTIPNALLAGFVRDRFNSTVVELGDKAPGTRTGGVGGSMPLRMQFVPDGWGEQTLVLRYELDIVIEEDVVP